MSQNAEQSLKNIFKKLRKEQLVDFLLEYSRNDNKFVNAVKVRFREPEFEEELTKIESEIHFALSRVSDYRTHDSWGNARFDVSDIVKEINIRADQGHIRLAFMELEILYRNLLANFEYQGECEISMEAESCLENMSEIADNATLLEDKEYIFNQCMNLVELEDGKDYGADYEHILLKIAAKFVAPENRIILENSLTLLSVGWREKDFVPVQLDIIQKIEGDDAADAFISKNLRIRAIRDIAFERAMSAKNFSDAEKLCIDTLSEAKQEYYRDSMWLKKLYSVYEMTENISKMTETAKKILLDGDIKYYDILKNLLQKQEIWESSYNGLLLECESKIYKTNYMEILAKEEEYNLLLEQLQKNPEEIYQYGKILEGRYPTDICAIFIKAIKKQAMIAKKRSSYEHVCSNILQFAKTGYKAEVMTLIDELKIEHKNRPAFIEELMDCIGLLEKK